MAKMSPEMKERIGAVIEFGKFVFKWGYIPTILYLGYQRGADPGTPPITPLSLLWA